MHDCRRVQVLRRSLQETRHRRQQRGRFERIDGKLGNYAEHQFCTPTAVT